MTTLDDIARQLFMTQQPTTGAGGGLLGGGDNWDLGDIGAGLLAASGPSLEPRGGFMSRLGLGVNYAAQRADARAQNDLQRAKLQESLLEQQGISEFQKWAAANQDATPDQIQAAALRTIPQIAIKSMLDPQATLAAALKGGQVAEQNAENVSRQLNNEQFLSSAIRARSGLQYLNTIPGGERVLTTPNAVPYLRKAVQFGATGIVPEWLSGIPQDQWGNVLDAVEAVEKGRAAITAASPNQAGVAGLQNTLTARGAGAGINLQTALFNDAVKLAQRTAELNKWTIPEMDTNYPWATQQQQVAQPSLPATPGGVGFQNGQIVVQPPPVYTPFAGDAGAAPASTAPAAAAPPPTTRKPWRTKIYDGPHDQYLGDELPDFRSEAEAGRMIDAARKKDPAAFPIGSPVIINGRIAKVLQ